MVHLLTNTKGMNTVHPTITVTFTLPDEQAVVEVIKALGADLAFIEARTNIPALTVADHPLAAATPVPTGNVHQLTLPMKEKITRRHGQAKGYLPRHPGVEIMADLHRDKLAAAAVGRSTVENMVAVLDHLAIRHGRDAFRVDVTDLSTEMGMTYHVVANALTALGKAKIIGNLSGRRRFINWVTR